MGWQGKASEKDQEKFARAAEKRAADKAAKQAWRQGKAAKAPKGKGK
jgi:hypothetical protein